MRLSPVAACARTSRTGTGARRTRSSATLPRYQRVNPVCPWVATTITSPGREAATMAGAARPRRSSVVAVAPRSVSVCRTRSRYASASSAMAAAATPVTAYIGNPMPPSDQVGSTTRTRCSGAPFWRANSSACGRACSPNSDPSSGTTIRWYMGSSFGTRCRRPRVRIHTNGAGTTSPPTRSPRQRTPAARCRASASKQGRSGSRGQR